MAEKVDYAALKKGGFMRTARCRQAPDRTKQEGNTMKDFEMRYVGSHVEVYTGSGVFLFSADTVREAMEELAE